MMPSSQFLKNLQRFRLVTFDITDTLLRFERPPAMQYAITAKQFGIENINEKSLNKCFREQFKLMDKLYPNYGYNTPNMTWQQWWIQLVKKVFHCVDKSLPDEKLNNLAYELLTVYRTAQCWSLIENATDILQKMRDADKCIGVISNFDPSLEKILNEMQLRDKFHFIVTSYEVGVAKPSPGIFKKSLEKYGVQPHEALHIGNRYDMDYMGARNSGWSALLLSQKVTNSEVNPDHVYDSIQNLLKALETREIDWQ